ncbi:dihydrofolate reductase [Flavobacterium alkalisoli]|uniref:Dihydrofolate reductase n=1 Tax=Flavobacterium alkalisoli TaxID=2602769 RepID=A0A5B9FYI9_9FLAO|nr:dihydrofolate reductase family protein [Flavobacterium alkalisoli]QEE51401.1 dihydrofolate reductase [Flavobacterium alkalisoli]
MRKVILDLAVTLDGFIEGPNGEIDWCIMDTDIGAGEKNFLETFPEEIDTVFYGRKSYELYGNYQPEEESGFKDFYDKINRMKKYIFSSTLTNAGENTIIRDKIAEEVNQIKNQKGKDIWLFGGASLITAFINNNLIDEYRLAVHPVVLGGGKPLFQDIRQRLNLELIEVRSSKSGVTSLYYKPASVK